MNMSEISRVNLFGKLNPLLYKAIESATVFCKLRGNPYVEVAHWLHQLLSESDGDMQRILRHYKLEPAAVASDMVAALDRLPRGATSISDLSEHVADAVERAWVYGTLLYGEAQVRGGYLIVGMLKTPNLRNILYGLSAEFKKIRIDDLSDDLGKIVSGSPEDQLRAKDGSGLAGSEPGDTSGALAPAVMGKQEALKKYTVDLTERAKKGEIDPVTGRDDEIRQIIDILMRRRQNNPILTGEAGVGKTAVAEGFALRIV